MTRARTLADMISDGVIGTTELADDAITPVKLDETGNYTIAQLGVNGTVTADGLTVDGNARIEEIGAIAKLTLERGGTANSADSAAVDMLETNAGSEGANFGDLGTNGFRLKLDGSANDFLIQSGAANVVKTRFGIDRDTGDISFYDTSGNAKFVWDASEESVTIGPASSTVGNLLLTTSGTTEYSNLFLENSTSYQLGTGGSSTGDYANKFYIYDSTAGAPRLSLDNSGKFGLGTMNPAYPLTLYKTDSGQTQIQFQNSTTGGSTGNGFGVGLDTQEEAFLWSYDSNDIYIGGTASGVAIRVNGSNGNVGLGAESENYYSNELVIACDDEGGMTFAGGTTHENYIMWADGTSGLDQYRGYIGYDHNNNWLRFGTNGTEKMKIDADGNVGLGYDTPSNFYAKELVIGGGSNAGITIYDSTGSAANYLMFADGTSGTEQYRGYLEFNHATDQLNIASYGSTRFFAWDSSTIRNVASVTGNGITFNGDTAAANALDDYETGTWDPYWGGDASNPTASYTNQNGWYVKIGKQVWCGGVIHTSSASGGSGNLLIRGFPFYSASDQANEVSTLCVGYANGFSTYYPTAGYMGRNRTFVNVSSVDQSNGTALIQVSYLTNTSYLNFNITYTTD